MRKLSVKPARFKYHGFLFLFLYNINLACADNDSMPVNIAGHQVAFDSSFLNLTVDTPVDLSRFSYSAGALPGTYKVNVYVNNQFLGSENIEFKSGLNQEVYPCLSFNLIKSIPFDHNQLPSDFFESEQKGSCFFIQKKLTDTQVKYDSNDQVLHIDVPQLYMSHIPQGTISPSLWDNGIPALLLGYNINGYHSESHGHNFDSLFGNLTAGLNIGGWYFRHNGSYTKTNSNSGRYDSINTYLQRDLAEIKTRLLLGQSNTTGELFDTLPYNGIQFATNDEMLPDSLQGYAPEIRGIANSNARVVVRQGNQVLYETTVSPGEFLINDLYPTGYGGNLEVTIYEADGSEQRFVVPYAVLTQLLRPGSSRYTLTVGELWEDTLSDKPAFSQLTYQRGLTNALTGYVGGQFNPHYYAVQVGTALGTQLGSFSVDVTQSQTDLGGLGDNGADNSPSGKTLRGQSYQIRYSKVFSETKSNISLAAYRFSTDSYMSFTTAMQAREILKNGFSSDYLSRAKNRVTLTYGQGLPEGWGQLYMSGTIQNYWHKDGTDEQYQVGYNNTYNRWTWGISVSRTLSSEAKQQTNYLLSVSRPLGRDYQMHMPQLSSALAHDSNGRTSEQVTISGIVGDESQYSYAATFANANQGAGATGTLSGNYRSAVSSFSASLSENKDYSSASAGMSGTVVAHSGGVTLTPYTSNTFALVEAKGAEGAKVSSYPGVKIDFNGYALVPYLNPYKMNEVSIDPKEISDNIELMSSTQKVAPYSGAVVKMNYGTKKGIPILINGTYNGHTLPFGANVLDSQDDVVGVVGQGGQVYARVKNEKGNLMVSWGNTLSSKCTIRYQLMPRMSGQSGIQTFNSICE